MIYKKLTKEFLQQEYVEKNKTAKQIAKEVGCGAMTVGRYLHLHGIPLRKRPLVELPEQVGKWRLIKQVYRRGVIHWECVCACGSKKLVRQKNLVNRMSLGCRRCSIKTAFKHSRWKGCGEISGRWFRDLKFNAESRANKPKKVLVTIAYLWELFLKQERRCALTGILLRFKTSHRDPEPMTASLDRIDSNGNYEEGNVQWVHKDINRMKTNFSQERFIELCKLVAARNRQPS